ncbi:hypothetical protein D3878_04680 [Noviherbaspirillum sedimenti]|uniref:Integrase catalytic domain-containing protein n=3 Tax=Noviherbaspirillum sedimenti TaxID=2320865 RepID=A0A3A3GJ53_9BURK|nr:hypothetical protein D3878_04680 [Noviherbaspirillum sedimenti]
MPDGELMGWHALIKGKRSVGYTRHADLPEGRDGNSKGFAGAFDAFLGDHPEIRARLEAMILKRRGEVHEARISAKSLHKVFITLCESAGISSSNYPFNSKSLGRRSLERFMHKVASQNLVESTASRYGKDAIKRLATGTGYSKHIYSMAPYDLVGLDAHKLHCFGTVQVNGPAGSKRVAIERLWIVPVLEGDCAAILGYSVGIRTECNAAVIENALISAMSKWSARKPSIPGMEYLPGAGLPSGVFPELAGRGWATLMVDNAAPHYAKAVAERARRRIGCFLNFGPVGHWEHRGALERLMATLEAYGFSRLPSSTGSSPADPKRDDPVRKAIDLGIDWEHLLDLIDITLANYNVTPHAALGNRSPLSVLRDKYHEAASQFLPRSLPPPSAAQPELGIAIETRFVRGNKAAGRRPYIEVDRVRYTSPVLANAMSMIGKQIRLHIRESDLSTIDVYLVTGESLGTLRAQGVWGRCKHSRELRKQFNALDDAGELLNLPGSDPVQKMLAYYAGAALKQTEKNRLKVSRAGTKLAHTAHSTGKSLEEVKAMEPARAIDMVSAPEKLPAPLIQRPRWKAINS